MSRSASESKVILRLCFRLLPVQVLLAMVGSVNGIITTLFASNFIGDNAMSAVGLYAPMGLLIGAVTTMLAGGAQVLCAQFKGKNQVDHAQQVFSLDLAVSLLIGLFFSALLLMAGAFDLTRVFTKDDSIRHSFNQYLMGLSIGIVPQILAMQLSGFLSLENKTRRALIASLLFIAVNPVLNCLFIVLLKMEAIGLAYAASLGNWIFCLLESHYFFTKKAILRFSIKDIQLQKSLEIIRIGAPGALTYGYQAIRGILVNGLILSYVGSPGLSAFTACNTFLGLFWAIPGGMQAVTRMLMNIYTGEEDRESLIDTMRVALFRFVPLMTLISFIMVLCAVPFTYLYFQDPALDVFSMTVWGFRILPLCMPLSVILMQFINYGQSSNKQLFLHTVSIIDGVAGVSLLSLLLVPVMGIRGVYWANVGNGVLTTLFILGYAWIRNRSFPRTLEALMVIPKDFGAEAIDRLDLSVRSREEVIAVSEQVQAFCLKKGIPAKQAGFSALCLEEMTANIVEHGFKKDKKRHAIDIRVVYKEKSLILRIKDDCIPFDPAERKSILDPEEPTRNIGIRMVYAIARSVEYQNILGLNVLTIKV